MRAFRRELSSTELGRIFAVLFQDSSVTADVGAVDNFGRGLGFVSEEKPREFDPVHCPFFDVIRTELAQAEGDLNLHTFLREIHRRSLRRAGRPAEPVLARFCTLCAASMLSRDKTRGVFHPKTGRRPRDNRLGFADVPMVTWQQRRLHKIFDRLVQVQGPGWNDFVEYFRELDETLQATTAPEQIITQQERLGKVFADWSHKVEAIRTRLVGFARNLEQDISAQVAVLDTLSAVCQTTLTISRLLPTSSQSNSSRMVKGSRVRWRPVAVSTVRKRFVSQRSGIMDWPMTRDTAFLSDHHYHMVLRRRYPPCPLPYTSAPSRASNSIAVFSRPMASGALRVVRRIQALLALAESQSVQEVADDAAWASKPFVTIAMPFSSRPSRVCGTNAPRGDRANGPNRNAESWPP